MKDRAKIALIIILTILIGLIIMAIAGCDEKDGLSVINYNAIEQIKEDIALIHPFMTELNSYSKLYDPNRPEYKFLQPAPKDWTDRFGDTERTCLIHAISELRVVVAAQSRRLLELEKKLEPNEVLAQ